MSVQGAFSPYPAKQPNLTRAAKFNLESIMGIDCTIDPLHHIPIMPLIASRTHGK